jgi:hypothetical protein
LQVDRSKHIRVNGEDNCKCKFQIRWLAGPNVEQSAQVHCENIFLLRFDRIASHPVLKEAAKYLKHRKCSNSQNINNDANDKITGNSVSESDVSFACNSVVPSLVGPANNTTVQRDISRDRIVIVEDENGFLVCSIQKSK